MFRQKHLFGMGDAKESGTGNHLPRTLCVCGEKIPLKKFTELNSEDKGEKT